MIQLGVVGYDVVDFGQVDDGRRYRKTRRRRALHRVDEGDLVVYDEVGLRYRMSRGWWHAVKAARPVDGAEPVEVGTDLMKHEGSLTICQRVWLAMFRSPESHWSVASWASSQ